MAKQRATKPKAEEAKQISQRIIKMSKDYSVKSIEKWRRAKRAAEDPHVPDRTLLYDLFDDLKLDNHFIHIRRRMALNVTAPQFQLMKDGEVDEIATKLFRKKWFRKFRKDALDSEHFGFSLLELTKADIPNQVIEFTLINRKHVSPEQGAWMVYQYDRQYQYYRDTPAMNYLIEVGERDNLGFLDALAPTIIYKKIAMLCWSEFCERFGMPLVKAKTNTRDAKGVSSLEGFLRNMASKSYAIIDNSEELDFVESVKSDAYQVFDKFIERCNSEMSKAVLLQTLATDSGDKGARSLGEVHKDSMDDVAQENKDFVTDLVNEQLIPLLIKNGFDLEGREFTYLQQKSVTKDSFEQDKWLEENFEIDEQHFADKYGVKINARKEKQSNEDADKKEPGEPKAKKEEMKALPDSVVKLHAALHELYNSKHNHA